VGGHHFRLLQANRVFPFFGKFGIVRQLERANAVPRQLVGIEDALQGAQATRHL